MENAFIKEIFTSLQGEALHIGEKQIFIRFCGCNLKCDYCDTDFSKDDYCVVHDKNLKWKNPISAKQLADFVNTSDVESVSLTGGEPLLYPDFLQEFLPLLINKSIYLETNGTLYEELKKIINFVDTVSMDIKLQSATKQPNKFDNNSNFIKIALDAKKECFAKIVVDKNYDKTELLTATELVKEFDIPLIIQPMDCKEKSNNLNKNDMIELYDLIYQKYRKIRLIPQVHKFLNLL